MVNFENLFNGIYNGKKILITGNTGFKGSWLQLWLEEMGAIVKGISLIPNTNPSHFQLLNFTDNTDFVDINNFENLKNSIIKFKPEIVFHLAAQPLVRLSYSEPLQTLQTNILGTANVLEICKKCDSVKAIVNITTDKCYDNKEWIWGYREFDALGGFDPYSASKACSEIISNSYRNSFFNVSEFKKSHNILLATVRAGNVIGGGDWADDRLIPDIMKATIQNKKVVIRNPKSIRPWQHVLEPLSGYLLIGQRLLEENVEFSEAWNFGSSNDSIVSVIEILDKIKEHWKNVNYEIIPDKSLHEANLLQLDSTKAIFKLGWKNVWNIEKTIEKTALWYKAFYLENKIISKNDLLSYVEDAKIKKVIWA